MREWANALTEGHEIPFMAAKQHSTHAVAALLSVIIGAQTLFLAELVQKLPQSQLMFKLTLSFECWNRRWSAVQIKITVLRSFLTVRTLPSPPAPVLPQLARSSSSFILRLSTFEGMFQGLKIL